MDLGCSHISHAGLLLKLTSDIYPLTIWQQVCKMYSVVAHKSVLSDFDVMKHLILFPFLRISSKICIMIWLLHVVNPKGEMVTNASLFLNLY